MTSQSSDEMLWSVLMICATATIQITRQLELDRQPSFVRDFIFAKCFVITCYAIRLTIKKNLGL